jgi:hypothetical protein
MGFVEVSENKPETPSELVVVAVVMATVTLKSL